MYFKLSLRNVKRSFKDYGIYFLTLTFAVSLFYVFNSISAQQSVLELSSVQEGMIEHLMGVLSGLSVFISVILGFLIIFANQFLIKRRKKEFGLYMTLGMGKKQISRILITETFAIGLLSLFAGLIMGFILSQGMSMLTAGLFEANIKGINFVFSFSAMAKTIVYFVAMFGLVMIFNTVIISRYKLIDLLTAMKKNESSKMTKVGTSAVLFLSSIAMILVSFGIIIMNGALENKVLTGIMGGIIILGTILFFYSLPGFVLGIIKKNKKIYFKGINIFVVRQLTSKVNTTVASMTIISLMLFLTITVLSTGIGYKKSTEIELQRVAPFDASISFIKSPYPGDKEITTIKEMLDEKGIDVEKFGAYKEVKVYNTDVSMGVFEPYMDMSPNLKNYINHGAIDSIKAISYSDYKNALELSGKKPLESSNDEMLIITNMQDMLKVLKSFISDNNQVMINDKGYKLVDGAYQMASIETENVGRNYALFVLPDDAVKGLEVYKIIGNIQYKDNKSEIDEYLPTLIDSFYNDEKFNDDRGFFVGDIKTVIYEETNGFTTTAIYIGIYIGLVFLISSAAVLALQQLSEAADNVTRYNMLKRIGVTKKMINKAIFKQVFIYFMIPLSLALVNAGFTIYIVSSTLTPGGALTILLPTLFTALMIILIYGGYFYATYLSYKQIVK